MSKDLLRLLPSVDRVLADDRIQRLIAEYSHDAVVAVIRTELDAARQQILSGGTGVSELGLLVDTVESRVRVSLDLPLRHVINATGVVLHTNLGRAPLSQDAVEAVGRIGPAYTNLEFDLTTGSRGSRHELLDRLLGQLTGAESSLVVNNNAAAVLLVLTSLAKDREVIVSRGQAVEIGGGFRVPDVLRQSGARLVEVGTTNRTYLRDYASAITPETAAILRVHPSNFRVVGFTHEPELGELARLAEAHRLVLIDDLGSGSLLDTERFGLAHEPMVQESLAAGAHAVCFSSDKLLGGPQGGIILGRKSLLREVGSHPLFRALRADKIALTALAATLLHYIKGEAVSRIPVWRMIAMTVDEARSRVETWRRELGNVGEPRSTYSTIGGGSLPGQVLPTVALALDPQRLATDGGRATTADTLALRLRRQSPAIVGRIDNDELLLDPRTVAEGEDELLLAGVRNALGLPS